MPDGTQIDYLVDGTHRRIGKQVNGTLSKAFLYQNALPVVSATAPPYPGGAFVVAELDAAGGLVSRFLYGSKRHVPDAMLRAGKTYRLISDERGSVRLVVDSVTGAIAQRIDYDAWGNVMSDSSPGFQPFGFAGGLYDADTGLVRFGARDYDARVGRWTAKDPIRFEGGQANVYVYVDGNPVNAYDPTGLVSWKCFSDCVSAQGPSTLAASALTPLCGPAAIPVGAFFASTVASACYFACEDLESRPPPRK